MPDAGTLTVTITGDTSKLSDSLKKASSDVTSFSNDAGHAASSFLDIAKGVFTGNEAFKLFNDAVDGVTGAIRSVIDAGIEDQKIQTQTAAVLKSTGNAAGETAQSIEDLAKHLSLITPFSNDAVQSTENLLLTFTHIGKNIFPQATEATLNMATALGEDTKSAAIQLGKALQDPVLGITALRRVGVNFSDAQKEVVKQLVETGQSAKAQAMILTELQTEFGGSAVAAGTTFAGAMAILGNQFEMFKETVGKTLIEAVIPFINQFNTWAQTPEAQAKIKDITDKVAALATEMSSWVKNVAIPWITQHWPQIQQAIKNAWETFSAFSKNVSEFAGNTAEFIKKLQPLLSVLGEIAGFTFDVLAHHLSVLGDGAKTTLAVLNAIADAITRIAQGIGTVQKGGAIVAGSGSLLNNVGNSNPSTTFPNTRAAGGNVSGNTPYMVGENGPELFVPSTAGSIRPNSGTNSTSNVTINITGPIQMANDYSVDQLAKRLGQQLQLTRMGV